MDFVRKELIEKALDEINELELECKKITNKYTDNHLWQKVGKHLVAITFGS